MNVKYPSCIASVLASILLSACATDPGDDEVTEETSSTEQAVLAQIGVVGSNNNSWGCYNVVSAQCDQYAAWYGAYYSSLSGYSYSSNANTCWATCFLHL